jgi:small subunit ribosomal protein S12
MVTLSQPVRNGPRIPKKKKCLVPALKHCPHKRGTVQRLFIEKPKKPNSARRQAAKVKLSTGRIIACHLSGEGHTLAKHSVVLVRGGRCQDLIGFRYRPIRGVFDYRPVAGRISRKSKYGVKGKSAAKS